MFEVGSNIIEDVASAAESLSKAAPTPVHALETSASASEPMPHVMASRGTKRRATVHLALGRSADKPARYTNESAGIGVGGPIIAVEEGKRTIRQAKDGTRIVRQSKSTLVEKKGKNNTRLGVRGASVIAIEESRRKSKSGRG